MSSTTSPDIAPTHRPLRPVSHRWHSLDVLKGLALWAMIAHHVNKWTGGRIDERFWGYDHFIVTDLAAPMFGVGLGAAAVVVGSRINSRRDLPKPVWRWTQIFLVGVAIDFATHHWRIVGRGVLPTLAVVGLAVTLLVAAGLRSPWGWWLVAAGCVLLCVPATKLSGDSLVVLLISGPFALPVYGVFGAAGAAIAAHALGRPERSLPLRRAAIGVLVTGLVVSEVSRGVVAPEGVWPPARYPGHLGFTLWGLVATLVIWAVARATLRPGRAIAEAVARAGRRTLPIFAAHFVVKIALQRTHLTGDLDTWRWGLVVWTAVIAGCALTTIPWSPRRRP
ncbi:MAG: heparan-alpha-glucosaminide N-acetyltransferase domain-containing protein [Acidimicrobiales bacterium]